MKTLVFPDGLTLPNPVPRGSHVCYDGPVGRFEHFGSQREEYGRLQATLVPFCTELDHVWAGYRDAANNPEASSRVFVVADCTRHIVWRKYTGPRKCSESLLYVYGKRIKLTCWLNFDPLTRAEFYDTARLSVPPQQHQ